MRIWYKTLWLFILLFFVVFASCREDFEFTRTTGTLGFSKDTVFLDTVFTNIGSSTYTLKVYNQSNDDILIPQVVLRNGDQSKYRLNVDGLSGNSFSDIPLLAKDSLFVFVETTFDIAAVGENEFIHTDAIRFGNAGNYQDVELVTLVRDAIFLYPSTQSDGSTETLLLGLDENGNEIRIEGFLLEDEELTFTNEKPYVIYGYAAVGAGKTLTANAGARVHFHKDSGILIGTGGSFQVNGALSTDSDLLENEVIFEGDRLEPEFEDVAGQWGTLWLASGSTNNQIRHLTIKNATVGILADGDDILANATLELFNTQIHNSSSVNLWARNAKITAQNTVFGSAGDVSLYCNFGGDYDFKHCTIANYWNQGFRNAPALLIDDNVEIGDNQFDAQELLNASFANCVVDGNRNLELLFSNLGNGAFNYRFSNCSIRFNDTQQQFTSDPLYDFTDQTHYSDIVLNPTLSFLDPGMNDFQLTLQSGVLDLGNEDTALEVPFDILGNSRVPEPDLGAFELNQ